MSVEQLRKDLVINADLLGSSMCLHTTWGLFSPRAIDEGSTLLLEHLEVHDDDIVLDLGCGYGPLGLSIAKQASQGQVHLVDKDFVAVDYCRDNASRNQINNAEVYLCLLYTSPSPRDRTRSRMPSSA